MKGVQCYELFERIALKNHAISISVGGTLWPGKKFLVGTALVTVMTKEISYSRSAQSNNSSLPIQSSN